MFEILIVLTIYTIAVLFFVPLEKIGRAQTTIKTQIKKLLDKAKD